MSPPVCKWRQGAVETFVSANGQWASTNQGVLQHWLTTVEVELHWILLASLVFVCLSCKPSVNFSPQKYSPFLSKIYSPQTYSPHFQPRKNLPYSSLAFAPCLDKNLVILDGCLEFAEWSFWKPAPQCRRVDPTPPCRSPFAGLATTGLQREWHHGQAWSLSGISCSIALVCCLPNNSCKHRCSFWGCSFL